MLLSFSFLSTEGGRQAFCSRKADFTTGNELPGSYLYSYEKPPFLLTYIFTCIDHLMYGHVAHGATFILGQVEEAPSDSLSSSGTKHVSFAAVSLCALPNLIFISPLRHRGQQLVQGHITRKSWIQDMKPCCLTLQSSLFTTVPLHHTCLSSADPRIHEQLGILKSGKVTS